MILKGKKVTLRPIEESDLELLRFMINDPEIEKMTVKNNLPVSEYEQRKWFETYGKCTDELLRLMIETEKDGTVGMVCLGDFDWVNRVAHRTDIKIVESKITESGIAIDTMNTLFKYAFDELNLNRIEGSVLDYNERAIAMNKMIGYEFEGVKRQAVYKNGRYHDLLMVSMLREDFREGARKVRKREQQAKEKQQTDSQNQCGTV